MKSLWYILTSERPLRRRSFLTATGSLAVAACWSSRALGRVLTQPRFTQYPFTLGVASGDPTASGVVLWTRLAPHPLEGGGMPVEDVEVRWRVAADEAMSEIVATGKTIANPEWAHSVHVEVEGLRPDRWYWYQFHAGSADSPVGRTRTMPSVDVMPERLRFAFASCQHFEAGFYTAYDHMVRENPDLIIHLGDYIYEGPGQDGKVRRHIGGEITTLDHYRTRHAQYKSDAWLQKAHAAAPWIVTWDDHEVDNNYASDISEKRNVSSQTFLQRRAAAYKAYYEHMPLRQSALPSGPDMKIYRSLHFGQLASFLTLDTRQYRSALACGGKRSPQCPEALAENRTLLGAGQREWLFDSLARSNARWNVLAQQVMMARVDRIPGEREGFAMDQWPGYESDRQKVLRFLRDQKVSNPVVLTGDIHSNWANDLVLEPAGEKSNVIAAEFVGTSISSGGDGRVKPADHDTILSENPFTRFFDSQRGYVACEITPKTWTTDYRVVEYVTRPGSPIGTAARFSLESGRPGLQRG